MSSAGNGSHNVIPEHAEAFADVRVNRLDDYDRIEREVREKIRTQLVPNAKVEYPVLKKPAAFLCSANRCSRPAFTAAELQTLVARLER